MSQGAKRKHRVQRSTELSFVSAAALQGFWVIGIFHCTLTSRQPEMFKSYLGEKRKALKPT